MANLPLETSTRSLHLLNPIRVVGFTRMTPETPRLACELRDSLSDTWWNELFRFTKQQFFNELVPVLQLPYEFSVDG